MRGDEAGHQGRVVIGAEVRPVQRHQATSASLRWASTQAAANFHTSTASLDSNRSTCLMPCFCTPPRAHASAWPMACTDKGAACTTPHVACDSDSTLLACRSSSNKFDRNVRTCSSFMTTFGMGYLAGKTEEEGSGCPRRGDLHLVPAAALGGVERLVRCAEDVLDLIPMHAEFPEPHGRGDLELACLALE